IYDAILALHDRGGQPVDLVTLTEELKLRGQLEDVGGYTTIADLWDAAPTAANAEYYAKIVRDRALVRGLIHASTEILRDAYDQGQPADELLEGAERKIWTSPRWASSARRRPCSRRWARRSTASTRARRTSR